MLQWPVKLQPFFLRAILSQEALCVLVKNHLHSGKSLSWRGRIKILLAIQPQLRFFALFFSRAENVRFSFPFLKRNCSRPKLTFHTKKII